MGGKCRISSRSSIRETRRSRMPDQRDRPILVLLTSHWISMLGVALVTLAGFILFFLGLALIPVGVMLAKRKVAAHLASIPDRPAAWRRAGLFFGIMTLVNV